MAGLSFPISPRVFFAAEAKYIFTGTAHFFGQSYGNLNGAIATGNIRINFQEISGYFGPARPGHSRHIGRRCMRCIVSHDY